MHICFIAFDYPSPSSGGGVGEQTRTLGRALVEAGHQVSVVALAGPGLPFYSEDEGVRVYREPQGNLHWYVYRIPGIGPSLALAVREIEHAWSAYSLVRKIHQRQPLDVVEGTETGALGVALWRSGPPLVIRLHGEPYTSCKYTRNSSVPLGLWLGRIPQRAAIRRAQVLISPSRAHAQEVSAELDSCHPPIEIIPNTLRLVDDN